MSGVKLGRKPGLTHKTINKRGVATLNFSIQGVREKGFIKLIEKAQVLSVKTPGYDR